MTAVLFFLGLVLLVGGAELLVRGASTLAKALGVTPLVIGLTVVAFGTSAPELAVSVQGAWTGNPDMALGNVVGSNIANVLLILGIAAMVVPLIVDQQLVRWDVPLLVVVSLVVWGMSADGNLGRVDGAFLCAGLVAYTVFAVRQSRKETKAIREEYAAALDGTQAQPKVLVQALLIVAGLVLLVVGARWLVAAAVVLAEWLGLSTLVISLTVVAVGTSLPEIATSVLATLRGQRDIAVGNAIGSNLFNLMLVLGLTAMVAPKGIPVPKSALDFDLPVMVAVAVACLPIFFTGRRINRFEGALFLAYYAVYIAYLILSATTPAWAAHIQSAMLLFVLPLTGLTLLIFAAREWRARRSLVER
jgi:cation:H+ antiporter